jgi:hypothetical protein
MRQSPQGGNRQRSMTTTADFRLQAAGRMLTTGL